MNLETLFTTLLLPISIAVAIDYAVFRRISKEKSNDNTKTEEQ